MAVLYPRSLVWKAMMGFGGFLVELAGADLRLGIPSLCNFQQYQNPLGVVGSRISLRFQLIGFGVWRWFYQRTLAYRRSRERALQTPNQ